MTNEGYVEDDRDILDVSRLVEDLRDVLLEYWVGIDLERFCNHLVAEILCLDRQFNNRRFTIKIAG